MVPRAGAGVARERQEKMTLFALVSCKFRKFPFVFAAAMLSVAYPLMMKGDQVRFIGNTFLQSLARRELGGVALDGDFVCHW